LRRGCDNNFNFNIEEMKREIKFRGLDLEFGNMIFGSLINHDPIPEIQEMDLGEMDYDYPRYEVKPETVGQFTGLTDKNGIEIYEGDIVAGYQIKDNVPTTPSKGQQVVFKNGCFEWGNEPLGWDIDNEGDSEPYDTDKWCLVIGNIHENPELL